jgi:hypothetical protein
MKNALLALVISALLVVSVGCGGDAERGHIDMARDAVKALERMVEIICTIKTPEDVEMHGEELLLIQEKLFALAKEMDEIGAPKARTEDVFLTQYAPRVKVVGLMMENEYTRMRGLFRVELVFAEAGIEPLLKPAEIFRDQ